jgi:hypothetical protein
MKRVILIIIAWESVEVIRKFIGLLSGIFCYSKHKKSAADKDL